MLFALFEFVSEGGESGNDVIVNKNEEPQMRSCPQSSKRENTSAEEVSGVDEGPYAGGDRGEEHVRWIGGEAALVQLDVQGPAVHVHVRLEFGAQGEGMSDHERKDEVDDAYEESPRPCDRGQGTGNVSEQAPKEEEATAAEEQVLVQLGPALVARVRAPGVVAQAPVEPEEEQEQEPEAEVLQQQEQQGRRKGQAQEQEGKNPFHYHPRREDQEDIQRIRLRP